MKVAMLTTIGEGCGIAVYSRWLVDALREVVEVAVHPIKEGKRTAEHYRAQADLLNMADVVHIQHEHSFWGNVLPGQSAFWTLREMIEKPVVITAHTPCSLAEALQVKGEWRPMQRICKEFLLLNRAYRNSVEITPYMSGQECIVHTEAARQELIRRGADPWHVWTIPIGVPELLPAPTGGAAIRERFGLSDKRILSIFGFISSHKGYELTLQILPEFPSDVLLVIAGGPRTPDVEPYARSLEKRIRERGLRDRVVITGYLNEEEVAETMAASEVVLVPHTFATGSGSVTFALAHGRPIIASDQDCFREIHERMPCLELFRSGNATHFAACLKALLKDPIRRQKMSGLARQYAAQHSWRDIAQRTIAIYERARAMHKI